MNKNNRILLNILATYGRSLLALICGLFSARWTLMALGEVDYGLMGVVAGLTSFIGFFNGLLAGAVGRFYAYAIGQAEVEKNTGLENCREWFNTALLIHTVVPVVLMLIGYPLGVYAVRHWLTIPPDRIEACVWAFRFFCCSCFIAMFNAPFSAMYTAKQYIAELTVYSVASSVVNVSFVYYMVTHPGVWLTKYALCICLFSGVPQLIICFRALQVFPECRFVLKYLWNWKRTKTLSKFAGWLFFGTLGMMLRGQGIAILVNKYFGPAVNSASAISNNIAGYSSALAGSMINAFSPVIINACGAKDEDLMRKMAYRTSKIGAMLVLFFALPLALELPEILKIWLENPPNYTAGLCWCVLITVVIDKMSIGHLVAITAKGKIAIPEAVLGTFLIMTLPIAWLFVALDWGVYSIGYAMILTTAACSFGRILFARKLTGMSVRYWFYTIFLPLTFLIICSVTIGFVPRVWMIPSFERVCVTTIATELVFLPLTWLLLLNTNERVFLRAKITSLKTKLFK